MNTQIKSRMIIISTLVIGILLGAVISGFVAKGITKSRRTSGSFFNRLEEKIEPDESQKEMLKEIISKHQAQMDKIISQFRTDMHNAKDSLKKEIHPILTPVQRERVEKYLERIKRGKHRKRDKSSNGSGDQ